MSDASINLVLRSAHLILRRACPTWGARLEGLRASRRTATSETEPAAILRDGASRLLRVGLNIKAHVSSPGQTPRKHVNAGKEHPRLGAGDCFLEIFGQPSAAVEPSKRSFNYPASPFGLERADTLQACDYLNGPLAELRERVGQLLAAIDTVSKDMAQLRKQRPDIFQQRHRAVNILNVGRVHLHGKQQAIRIGNDVAFSSLHLLTRIKPAWTATFRGLHALAVDDTRRGSTLASLRPTCARDQHTIHPPPAADDGTGRPGCKSRHWKRGKGDSRGRGCARS